MSNLCKVKKKTVAFGLPDELHFQRFSSEPMKPHELEKFQTTEEPGKISQHELIPTQGPIQDALKGSKSVSETVDFASLKVIELSRRLRELTACLLTERTKCRQLEDKVRMLETKLNQPKQNADPALPNSYLPELSERMNYAVSRCNQCQSLKTVLDKLTKSELMLTSLRNENHIMKTDLNEAKKILELETGEKIDNMHLWLKETVVQKDNVSDVQCKSTRGWRGRQQQIVLLKAKVKNLESRLNSSIYSDHYRSVEFYKDIEEPAITEASGATTLGLESLFLNLENPLEFSDRTQCPSSQQQYSQKQNRLIMLEQEKESLKSELFTLKSKYSKGKSRETSLIADVKEFKLRIEKLLDKGHHDDELINMLVDNNKTLQDSLKSELERRAKGEKEREAEMEQLSSILNQKKNEVEKLEKILSQKDEELLVLEQEINVIKRNPPISNEKIPTIEAITQSEREERLAKEVSLLEIERDGLRKLIENINTRVDTLLEENAKLNLECILVRENNGRNIHSKSRIPNRIESNGSKTSGSTDSLKLGLINQNSKSYTTDHLVTTEFVSTTLSKAGLSASAASIVAKRINELQKALSDLHIEMEALKSQRDKLQAARKDDFNLLAEVVKQLRNCSADESAVH